MILLITICVLALPSNTAFHKTIAEEAIVLPKTKFVNLSNSITIEDDTIRNPFSKYLGEWVMKDGIFETKFSGEYNQNIDPARSLVAHTPTNNSLIFKFDFVDATGIIFWTFDPVKKIVFHLSSNSIHPMARGEGTIDLHGNLELKLFYEGTCEDCSTQCGTCYRIYRYKFISEREIFFRATYYKNGKETGDYYGGSFIKKNS